MSQDSLQHKQFKADRRAARTHTKVIGTAERPRLSVHVSNRQVSAQLIDDDNAQTLAQANSAQHKTKGTLSEQAAWVGAEIAKQAARRKIKRVIFDRGKRKYHGRLKSLAEQARAGGLEF